MGNVLSRPLWLLCNPCRISFLAACGTTIFQPSKMIRVDSFPSIKDSLSHSDLRLCIGWLVLNSLNSLPDLMALTICLYLSSVCPCSTKPSTAESSIGFPSSVMTILLQFSCMVSADLSCFDNQLITL